MQVEMLHTAECSFRKPPAVLLGERERAHLLSTAGQRCCDIVNGVYQLIRRRRRYNAHACAMGKRERRTTPLGGRPPHTKCVGEH